MTSNHHTPIPSSPQQPANASTINGPLGELDEAITDHEARLEGLEADMPVPSGNPTEYLDGEGNWTVPTGTGAGVDGHVIQDEGIALPQRAVLNFVGAGVMVTNEAGGTQVEIPGVSDMVTKDGLTDWDEQPSNPSTPATNKWKLFFKSGGLYIMDDAGSVVGPITIDHGALTGLGDDDHPQYAHKGTSIDGLKLIWNSANSISVGTGECYAENGDRINVATMLTASSLSLSSSTWYHLYLYLSGGSPALEVVTTAPVAWKGLAYSKTGDTSRRYVGSVRTDGSGNILQFQHDPASNYCALMYPIPSILTNGKATTYTSVAANAYAPTTARFLMLTIVNADATYNATLKTSDTSNDVLTSFAATRQVMTFPCNAAQEVQYKYGTTPANGLYLTVAGYSFER